MILNRSGYFDGRIRIIRRTVRDRQDNDARSVLTPLDPSGLVFTIPGLGIGNHKTRFRVRDRHLWRLFLIEQCVEMIVARIHIRRGDFSDFCFGQFSCREAAVTFPEAFERFVLVRANKVARDPAMARNGHGRSLSVHPVATEIAGELRGWDGIVSGHMSSLFRIIYATCGICASCKKHRLVSVA